MEAISPSQLALVIVDIQRGLFCIDPAPFEAAQVVARINSVILKARAAEVPIIFVQHDGPPGGGWLVPLTGEWELLADLQRRTTDRVIRKTTGDAFYSTNLERELRSLGVRSILLMGYATDFCIDSTLRSAASKDFEVFVISDAHTTNDSPALTAKQIRDHFNWIWSDSSTSRGVHLLKAEELAFCR